MAAVHQPWSISRNHSPLRSHSNLNVHMKRIHPEKTSASDLKRTFIFKSVTCKNEYNSKQILMQNGSKTNHPAINEDTDITKTLYTCELCQHTTTKANLMNHIQSYNINVGKELLKFNTFKEFEIMEFGKMMWIKPQQIHVSREEAIFL
ncbi:uncharacterized protein LOC143190179 [Rhynchophorus ferrugineus]|uniref:uncharacterized protein LOC143190179 n=1 Tax=Rhynchophorus ferrugineus TaxID=354439 RepID=UPI003FCEB836